MKKENKQSFGYLRKRKCPSAEKSEGISEKKAIQIVASERKPKEFVKVKLGAENDVPLWEITYIDQEGRYTYYYLEFQDGKYAGYYSIEK